MNVKKTSTNDIIDLVRKRANILEIARDYTKLEKRGTKYVGLCPFHSEKTPSFTVDPRKKLFHCFGCGAGGDVFTLVMQKKKISFPKALNILGDRYHVKTPLEFIFECIPENIEKGLLSLAGWGDGKLSHDNLSGIIAEWVQNRLEDKRFLFAIMSFAENLGKVQESLRKWDKLSAMEEKDNEVPF